MLEPHNSRTYCKAIMMPNSSIALVSISTLSVKMLLSLPPDATSGATNPYADFKTALRPNPW